VIGIVTGLQAEAKIVRSLPCCAISGGGRAEVTRRKIDGLIEAGADGLISFGIAGAADPALKTGDVVVSATVIDADGRRYVGSSVWLEQLLSRLPASHPGHLYGSDRMVSAVADKAQILKQHDCIAVDMESHHTARAATRHQLPFIVIRAIADTASEQLPEALAAGVDADGRTQAWPIFAALVTGRLGFGAVMRAGRSSGRALASLRQCRPALDQLFPKG
jgi:hopanoid-associated phosphorylase